MYYVPYIYLEDVCTLQRHAEPVTCIAAASPCAKPQLLSVCLMQSQA
jgi:hypothetical protein